MIMMMMIHTPQPLNHPSRPHTHTNQQQQQHPTPTPTPHLFVFVSVLSLREKYERETITTTTNLVFVCVSTDWLCASVYRKLQQVQQQQQQRLWILRAEAGVQSVREDRKTCRSKSGAEDTHSSSGWTATNATICLLQWLGGWILCERERRRGSRGIWVRSFFFFFFLVFLQMGGCLLLLWCSWKDDHHHQHHVDEEDGSASSCDCSFL